MEAVAARATQLAGVWVGRVRACVDVWGKVLSDQLPGAEPRRAENMQLCGRGGKCGAALDAGVWMGVWEGGPRRWSAEHAKSRTQETVARPIGRDSAERGGCSAAPPPSPFPDCPISHPHFPHPHINPHSPHPHINPHFPNIPNFPTFRFLPHGRPADSARGRKCGRAARPLPVWPPLPPGTAFRGRKCGCAARPLLVCPPPFRLARLSEDAKADALLAPFSPGFTYLSRLHPRLPIFPCRPADAARDREAGRGVRIDATVPARAL
eukprot:213581-Chlamydomonas_euryale.AAC.2